jgi:DnaK suppressor protein
MSQETTSETSPETRQKVIRERLEAQLRAAESELADIDRRLQEKGDYGPGTGDPLVVRWEFDLAQQARVQARAEELQEALARLEEGTYGICESCGRPIAIERLEALPRTTLCIECARQKDER